MKTSPNTKLKYELYNDDCTNIFNYGQDPLSFDLIYTDPVFHSTNFTWITYLTPYLRPGGAFWVHTDQRMVVKTYIALESAGLEFVNWIVWPYDWGGRPRDAFGRKHDDLLYFYKPGGPRTFNADAVRIPKLTKGTAFDAAGRDKIPTDVWTDIGNFHTLDKERIRSEWGTSISWQKPERLLARIILACTKEGDTILDPMMGTGTTGKVAKDTGRNFVGFERDTEAFEVARKRIVGVENVP